MRARVYYSQKKVRISNGFIFLIVIKIWEFGFEKGIESVPPDGKVREAALVENGNGGTVCYGLGRVFPVFRTGASS